MTDPQTVKKEALTGKLVAELQKIAQQAGVSEVKGLKKAQLIDAILTKHEENGGRSAASAGPPSTAAPAPAVSTASPATEQTPAPTAPPVSPADGQGGASPSTAPSQQRFDREEFRRDRNRGRRRRSGRDRDRGGGERVDRDRGGGERVDRPMREFDEDVPTETKTGILDILPEGYGFLRTSGYLPAPEDVYVHLSQVRRFGLRRGDEIVGQVRRPREGEKYQALVRVDQINEKTPEEVAGRPKFESWEHMTPLYPDQRVQLEIADQPNEITARIIDLVAPIGKGQRGMIVSPPKAGKTTIMKQIANSITSNAPECHLIVLLVDERPEEVTDMKRSVNGEVIYSTFDRPSDDHIQIAELTLDRAKRLVELGRDVVIMLDGITRLSRAYNLAMPASGRVLSGGVESTALQPPRRFFAAARNIENGGSLTILATALVETGSRMDEVIFEEFKGTGNWELRLDRRASEKRLFPAINIEASGTRKEELLLDPEELTLVWRLRRVLHGLDDLEALELLIDRMRQTKSNEEFLRSVKQIPQGK